MTGYGRGNSEREGRRASVEIRSVNHRFLDLKLRGASLEPAVEEKLRQRIGKVVSRGALSVAVRIETRGSSSGNRVDHDAARRVHGELESLQEILGLTGPIPLGLICSQPGVLVGIEAEDDSEATGKAVLEAAAAALDGLLEMRAAEGKSLAVDLKARLATLGTLATELGELAKTSPQDAQRRLQDRLDRLLKNNKVQVDDARLAQEVAIAADRLDVTEELVRVSSHLDQIESILAEDGSIGRRLDFLVQELGREFNTVASKSQSADIARLVVEAKAEMEKIREQVQNIE